MTLEECFSKGLLRKIETSQEMMDKERTLAEQSLDEAESLHELGHEKASAIFIYTSMFHSGRTLLFRKGYSERSHTCLSLYLVERFVNAGKLEMKFVNALDELRQRRHQTFYGTPATYEAEEIEEFLELADEFAEKAKELVKS